MARCQKSLRVFSFREYIIRNSNFISRFLDGFPLDRFAFVGILEYWEESILEFGKLIGKDLKEQSKFESYPILKYYIPNQEELTLFEELNQKDINLWKKYAEKYK